MFLCIICIYISEEGKARAVETYGSLDKLADVFHGGQVLCLVRVREITVRVCQLSA